EKLTRPPTDAEKNPATLLANLRLDSLDRMDIAQHIEQRFNFRSDMVPTNLGELWGPAQGFVDTGSTQPFKVAESWFAPRADSDAPFAVLAPNIIEGFVRQAI